MKHTQDTILSVFRLFFGRLQQGFICFRDLVTFSSKSIFDLEQYKTRLCAYVFQRSVDLETKLSSRNFPKQMNETHSG